jgi:peptidase S41-like protein
MKWVCVIFAAAGLSAAEPVPLVNGLSQSALQTAFQVLRRDYIRHDDLTFEELNRAALEGLLERVKFSADLVQTSQKKEPAKPGVHAEFLAPGTALLRPETLGEGEAAIFEKELGKVVEQKARHLILDLRAATLPGSFDEAALMLQCFVPSGEVLFKMKQLGQGDAELFVSKHDPVWPAAVVVLVDHETGNAAEALAACLKQRGRALLVGEKTRGAPVRYSEVQLDDKVSLRYASAELMLPDGSTYFKTGLKPDHPVAASMEEKHQVIEATREASLKPFVFDRVRPRFNEAALVAGTNPELDAYVKRSLGEPLPGDEGQTRDVVVQHALDLLTEIDLMAQSKINWNRPASPPAPLHVEAPKALPATP